MSVFGIVPPEPPRIDSLDDCAPQLREAVEAVLAAVPNAVVFESLRTDERQAWLYGFGRDYDDGRGLVTHAATAQFGWHFFGLAVDIIHQRRAWDAGDAWFQSLGEAYEAHGLTWGGRWKMADKPHGQWAECRTTPSDAARSLYLSGGNEAVWDAVHAS